MEYRHSRNQVYLMNYHIIFCPKRRKPVLMGEVKQRLDEIIREVCRENEVDVLALEIMPEHLHLFVSVYPQLIIHKFIKAIKGRSAHHLRQEFPYLKKLPSLWTNSYFISTAGNVSNKTIQAYIETQSRV